MPADVVPANFRHGARYAWAALLEGAREDERPALLESADLLFEFVDRVSQLFSDTYESTRPPAVVSDEERRALGLLAGSARAPRWSARTTSSPSGSGFELSAPYRPFALAAPATVRAAPRHARRPPPRRARAGHAEGRRVVGVAPRRAFAGASWASSRTGAIAQGAATPRAQLSEALDELRTVVDLALGAGPAPARWTSTTTSPELLLRKAPRGWRRGCAPGSTASSAASDPELARTLDALIEHDFDRGATAAALPVHRNTLGNRINRIRAITGLDVDEADGHGLVWLAWLDRDRARRRRRAQRSSRPCRSSSSSTSACGSASATRPVAALHALGVPEGAQHRLLGRVHGGAEERVEVGVGHARRAGLRRAPRATTGGRTRGRSRRCRGGPPIRCGRARARHGGPGG